MCKRQWEKMSSSIAWSVLSGGYLCAVQFSWCFIVKGLQGPKLGTSLPGTSIKSDLGSVLTTRGQSILPKIVK